MLNIAQFIKNGNYILGLYMYVSKI